MLSRFLLFFCGIGEIHRIFPSFALISGLAGELPKLGEIDLKGACLAVLQNAEVGV